MTPYYEDGGIVIYHGDCHEVGPGLRKIALVVADPPYVMPAQHYASRAKWQRSWGDTSIMSRWWSGVLDALVPALVPDGHFAAFCDDESYAVFYPGIYCRFELINALVWRKPGIGMGAAWRHSHEMIIAARWRGSKWNGGGSLSDVLDASAVPSTARLHPVDKPTELLAQLIGPTTDPGDTVLDPFMGGGSTLVAAKNLGRKAIGIEIEERYCEIAAERLSQGVLDLGGAA